MIATSRGSDAPAGAWPGTGPPDVLPGVLPDVLVDGAGGWFESMASP
jgi:hypothetical protein